MKLFKTYIFLFFLWCCPAIQAQNIPDAGNLGPGDTAATPVTISNLPSGIRINYTKVITPVTAVKTDVDFNAIKDDCAKSSMQTICTDGLGRPLQTIIRKPFNSSTKKDIVRHHIYDAFGREKRSLLPYAKAEADPAKNGKFSLAVWTNLRGTYNALGYSTEQFLYSEDDLEESPLGRLKGTKSQGNNWIGKSRSTTVMSTLNTSGPARWTIGFTATLPAVSGNYTAGTLTVTTITDEESNTITTYTDTDGKLIMKDNMGIQLIYVYDNLNRLRFEIPQKAITAIAANGQVITQQVADNLCTRYEYDEDGRLIILKKPGIGETHYVYDKYDQVIFLQDPLKRAQGKWVFNKYDPAGRLIQTGLMNNEFMSEPDPGNPAFVPANVIYTRGILQNLVSYVSLSDPLLQYIYNDRIYKFSQYQNSFANATVFVEYYFDSYDFSATLFSSTPNYGAFDVANSNKIKGLLTGTKALLSDNSASVVSCNFYNSRSELIQVKRTTPGGSTVTTSMGYDFKGRMISSHMTHGSYTIVKKYQYDALDRIMYVHHRINTAGSFTKIAQYNYDDIGRVSTKVLGNMSHPVNYEYNIRNWVTGINRQYCADKTLGFYFGMEIFYDKGYTTAYLDGKIAGIQWRNKGTSDELRSYGYQYEQGRLTHAEYVQKDQGVTNPYDWGKTVKDFTTTVSYDPNGNITAMKHKGINTGKQIITLDDLAYTYNTNSNMLKKIVENTTDEEAKNPDLHNGLGDFRDNLNNPSAPEDYAYDANGNTIHDENRNANIITNDWFTINKPTYVEDGTGNHISYVYDALGNLLRKKTFQYVTALPAIENTYDYTGDIIYKNGTAELIMHDEGRVRVESAGTAFAYDYFLKDHLENVRSIITEDAGTTTGTVYPGGEPGYVMNPDPNGTPLEPGGTLPSKEPVTYMATMELSNSEFENSIFENIESTRDLKPLSSDPVSDRHCAKLTGSATSQGMGPGIILKVSAEDEVQIGVQTFFTGTDIPGGVLPLQTLATGLVGLLTGGAVISPEGIALTRQGMPVSVSGVGSALTQMRAGQEDTTKPKAYLNYMMFDDRMQFLPEASGAMQVSVGSTWKTISLPPLTVPANGYIYVFTTNQTMASVRMDNMYVVSWTGRLLEETHYYPYGLSFDTYKAPGNKTNDVKYNSQFLEQNEYVDVNGDTYGLEWYDFAARSYDPQTGRWMQPDPMMQHASPYMAMGDNPASFTDPLGLSDGGPGGTTVRIVPDAQGTNGAIEVTYTKEWWKEGGGTQEQYMNYAISKGMSSGGGGAQTEWEKRNWNTYNDPSNGQSHKSFNPKNVTNAADINKEIRPYVSYGWSDETNRDMSKLMFSMTIPMGGILKGIGGLIKFGSLAARLTTAEGFLLGSITVKLPFSLKVGLYASQNTLKCGTYNWSTIAPGVLTKYNWFGRNMLQITKDFQPQLGAYTYQTIEKGTKIQFGLVGPQAGQTIGSWLQIYSKTPLPLFIH